MKMPAIWSKEGCLVRRKKVLLVAFLVVVLFWTRRGAWCLVFGKEDKRSWKGSLVLEKEGEEAVGSVSREWSLFLERKEDREERCLGGS